ncbi:MAG: signal peptidase I [Acholeplasmatales bacterium]|nr:signal peptidase I [Acholeplasmatales bacterium]
MEEKKDTSSNTKKLKKSSIIGYIVSILCLLLCLYITIEVIVANSNNRPPRIFNLSVSYVPTDSMEPTINAGGYVLFAGTNVDNIKAGSGSVGENHTNKNGDIIVFYNQSEDKYIIHRVVGIEEDSQGRYFITWGDHNPVMDELKVRDSMVYGKYVTTLGFMSIFSGGVNTNLIFFILVGIFVIMIAMQVVQMLLKSKTDSVKKKTQLDKEALREELKKQILEEEIAKLKARNEALAKENKKELESNDTNSNDETKD